MSEGLTLEIERTLQTSADEAFEAFVDADLLAQWWGPQGFTVRALSFPARAGESYRLEMQPPEGDHFHLSGEFREVDPPQRLAFTFRWEPPDPDDIETLAELEFRSAGRNTTAVTLRQGPFRTEERLGIHRDGWGESFDKLERLLATAS
jgi:uncharacterized protein YndB with AHSA1/START domain